MAQYWCNHKDSGMKCRTCGKIGHMQKDCNTNIGRVKYFKYGQIGHILARIARSAVRSLQIESWTRKRWSHREGKTYEISAEGPQEEEQESGEAIMMPLISL